MDHDEQLARQLDEEFKRGLVLIHPYIERLASVKDARLCRDWLDKLHGSVGEREDRNELLNELIVHVKAGILNRPFNEFPTDTSLSAIKTNLEPEYIKVDEDFSFSSVQEKDIRDIKTCSSSEGSQEPLTAFKPSCFTQKSELSFAMKRWLESNSKWAETNMNNQNVSVFDKDDDLESMRKTIENLKAQNEALKLDVLRHEKISNKTQQDLHNVNGEMISLKEKLSKLQQLNSTMESENTRITDDYKKTLNDIFQAISEKLKEVSEQKADILKIVASIDFKLNNSISRHSEPFKEERTKLKKEIEELKNKLITEKKKHQSEINNLLAAIAKKDEQLRRVDEEVKEQCNRMEEEVSNIKSEIDHVTSDGQLELKAKIIHLKKDLAKLEAANKKLVMEYEERLRKCKKENNQNSQRIKTEPLKSIDIENTISKLEERYKLIVSNIQARAAAQRRQDAQKIRELEEQLLSSKEVITPTM